MPSESNTPESALGARNTAQCAESTRVHEHVPTRPNLSSVVRCIVRGCDWNQHRPWPGWCQSCGASLIPADAIYCRVCGASDYDE